MAAVSAEDITTLEQLMGLLEDLPADQRAVLQLVAQRGRSYDEIATLLSIDRAAVRQRALDACMALTPDTVEPGPERALVTDYLLGQLPDQVADQVYVYLEAADADREWASSVAAELAVLSPRPLAEVPSGAAPPEPEADDRYEAPDQPPHSPEDHTYTPLPRDWEPVAAPPSGPAVEPAPQRSTRADRPAAAAPGGRSRALPLLLGGLVTVAVVVVVVVLISSGGSKLNHSATKTQQTPPASTTTASSTTTSTTGTTPTTTTPQLLAALNLTSPVGETQTVGVVQVIKTKGKVGIVIAAQGVPANGAHNAYAIWLYNSPTSYEFVGFIQNLVGKNGKFATYGKLPAGAASYKRLLVTLETHSNPKSPGEVVLSGPFREHP